MNREPQDPTRLTLFPVWQPTDDYELRIDGRELATVLQVLAYEYEEGRGAYILENLLDAVHCRLGELIVRMTARRLAELDVVRATGDLTLADTSNRKKVVRPLAGPEMQKA
jgi:hypothetical protein